MHIIFPFLSHLWTVQRQNLVLEKIDKNLGFTSPPLVGTESQEFPKIRFEKAPKIFFRKASFAFLLHALESSPDRLTTICFLSRCTE